jgi:hypothetical protein
MGSLFSDQPTRTAVAPLVIEASCHVSTLVVSVWTSNIFECKLNRIREKAILKNVAAAAAAAHKKRKL